MPLDPEIGLVGRDDIVALLDQFADRRPRQVLPIVVAFGPGGSGKTTLLDHVQRRFAEAPVARVNLDDAGSRSCADLLDVVVTQLRAYTHPQFGRLKLPRYALARAALAATPPADATTDPHRRARDFIIGRLTNLRGMADAVASVADEAPPVRGLGRALQPFLRWLVTLAVLAPARLRWLFGATFGATTGWYEHVAGGRLLGLRGAKIDSVIVGIWQAAGTDEPRDAQKLDRLLVWALQADLRAAYRRHRHRKVNCVLLLDGADLLSDVGYTLYPRGVDAPVPPVTDVLRLLAEVRLEEPDTPLLVVATKQQAAPLPTAAPEPAPRSGERLEDSGTRVARSRYASWRESFERARRGRPEPEAAYLTVPLRRFTLDQTRQFLAEWNSARSSPVESRVLVEEMYEVTHGHPLAVRLATQLVDLRYRRTSVLPSIRAMFGERVPAGEPTADPNETVGDYLLLRFLQRFRASTDGSERGRTQELLARLAAPRRLDVETVAVLANDYRSADDLWDRLAMLSFTERTSDPGTLVLHPLLRDLLVGRLAEQTEPQGGPSYTAVHELLRAYYKDLRRETDYLYHALALGDFHLVATRLHERIRRRDWHCLTELSDVVTAPMSVTSRVGMAQKLRARLQGIRATDAIGKLFRPDVVRLEAVVMASWSLHSSTSPLRRTPDQFERVVAAYVLLGRPGEAALEETLSRYRRLQRAAEENRPAAPAPPLPAYCRGEPEPARPYPKVFPPRDTGRRLVLGGALLLIVGYAGIYAQQAVLHCNPFGPLQVRPIVSGVLDDSRALSKEGDGQCIGVTDRPGAFAHGHELLGDDVEVAELSRLIGEQNAQVIAESRTPGGRPYVTVVVATMLSSADEGPQRDLSAGVNELRGAYLAQREWNRFDTPILQPSTLLRVVLANFGGNSVYAGDTARQIRRLAERDPTMIAVAGMGQTRDSTVEAAGILGTPGSDGPGIPMVGSVPSGTGFVGKPYFLRVAPSNDRQAEVAIDFAASDRRLRGRTPFLVFDKADQYSADLVEKYENHLQAEQRRTDPRLGPPAEMNYEADSNNTAQSLQQRVTEICQRSERPLILYAGRSNEMPTLLDELSRSTCGDQAVVLGGDDLSQLETADFRDLAGREEYVNGRLFFTTFAPTLDGWAKIRGGSANVDPWVRRFFADYESQQRTPGGPSAKAFRSRPNGHIILAYDALRLIMTGVDRLTTTTSDRPVDRGAVFDTLRDTTGLTAYPGVGGWVDFGSPDPAVPHVGADPKGKLVVVQEVVRTAGNNLESRYQFSEGS
ncbi:hypothetical protein [Actinopolymorpha alba]|uniref:hypothetical protein n=1 Tax=Actinopolymorpha alba TaxID=533267 RepID=UPI0003A3CABE|nr:hypothetical protein [Actinopolymorpha alba]